MEEAERNIALRAEQEDEERRQRSILEEERRRMLQEHIQKLEGYIPKGVLTQVGTKRSTDTGRYLKEYLLR